MRLKCTSFFAHRYSIWVQFWMLMKLRRSSLANMTNRDPIVTLDGKSKDTDCTWNTTDTESYILRVIPLRLFRVFPSFLSGVRRLHRAYTFWLRCSRAWTNNETEERERERKERDMRINTLSSARPGVQEDKRCTYKGALKIRQPLTVYYNLYLHITRCLLSYIFSYNF